MKLKVVVSWVGFRGDKKGIRREGAQETGKLFFGVCAARTWYIFYACVEWCVLGTAKGGWVV